MTKDDDQILADELGDLAAKGGKIGGGAAGGLGGRMGEKWAANRLPQGRAKEGLIKQHAGEKAARRIAQEIFGQAP